MKQERRHKEQAIKEVAAGRIPDVIKNSQVLWIEEKTYDTGIIKTEIVFDLLSNSNNVR